MSSPLKAVNPLLDRGYLSAVLAENGLRLSRDRGQNFLTDGGVLERILSEAGLSESEAVLEIGPGLGTMTLELRKVCPVVAVECDRGLARLLAALCPEGEGFALIREDFLKVDPERILRAAGKRALKVVSNLPYSLAGAALFRLFRDFPSVRRTVCTVQEEAADRIVAPPGNKEYGLLSVMAGAFGSARRAFKVDRRSFFPVPRVDSAVVVFDPAPVPDPDGALRTGLAAVAKAVFAQRRKMIKNTLERVPGLGYTAGQIDRACREAAIDPAARPEQLSPRDYVRLVRALASRGPEGER